METAPVPPPLPPVPPPQRVPPPPPVPPAPSKSVYRRHAMTFKMGGVLLLVLLLLIPLAMIRSLIEERQERRDQAVLDITSTWGGEQVVEGPVLVVPYRYVTKVWKERLVNGKPERMEVEETATAHAYFLPADLTVSGQVTPSKLHRGIYDAVVYASDLSLSGRFAPDLQGLGVAADSLRWEEAVVTLAVTDLRGVGDVLTLDLDGEVAAFAPGCRLPGHGSGITARVPAARAGVSNLVFQMALDLKGSQGIRFAPVGQKTRVKLDSAWPDPSFAGAFLPTERRVDEKGFDASWDISWYGRGYPQQATDQGKSFAFDAEAMGASLFGVEFLSPIDTYRMVERAAKYGILFIALIFTAFFLFEVLSSLSLHVFQYTLVGAALCLFYLALLALSEFVRFAWAYWGGAAASSLLIVLYGLKVLGSGTRTLIVAVELAAIYLYLYVVLQLQDYSLLFGTAGLFAVLGIVMYATRNVAWNTRD